MLVDFETVGLAVIYVVIAGLVYWFWHRIKVLALDVQMALRHLNEAQAAIAGISNEIKAADARFNGHSARVTTEFTAVAESLGRIQAADAETTRFVRTVEAKADEAHTLANRAWHRATECMRRLPGKKKHP